MSLREHLVRLGLRVGFALGPHMPPGLQRSLWHHGAPVALRFGLATPAHWIANAEVVLGRAPTDAEVCRAVESYLRYFVEMFALPGHIQRQARLCRVEGWTLDELRAAARDEGVVLALGHLANWDWAGAWAAVHDIPLSTVAEQLTGREGVAFLDYRRGLGMQVYGHRDPDVIEQLTADVAAGRVVCLLADRDLKGHGLPVTWQTAEGAWPITMPAGPAVVAQRSGATLRALVLRYDGPGLVMSFSEPITVGEGSQGLVAAMQTVADHLSVHVRDHVIDWHLFQPFFE